MTEQRTNPEAVDQSDGEIVGCNDLLCRALQLAQMLEQSAKVIRDLCDAVQSITCALPDSEILTRSVDTLNLYVRTRKVLRQEGIETIGQLFRMSEHELWQLKYMGFTSMNQLKERLGKLGLTLRSGRPG